jgi:predicted GTPase
MGNVMLINKVDQATQSTLESIEDNIAAHNPDALVMHGRLVVSAADPNAIKGKRVRVIEDGPTLTHGGMKYGAGTVAAKKYGAKELVDPRPFIAGEIKDVFDRYPDIGALLPAVGYSPQQVKDLQKTINASDADLVLVATPIDLGRVIKITKPSVRITYEYRDVSQPTLNSILDIF